VVEVVTGEGRHRLRDERFACSTGQRARGHCREGRFVGPGSSDNHNTHCLAEIAPVSSSSAVRERRISRFAQSGGGINAPSKRPGQRAKNELVVGAPGLRPALSRSHHRRGEDAATASTSRASFKMLRAVKRCRRLSRSPWCRTVLPCTPAPRPIGSETVIDELLPRVAAEARRILRCLVEKERLQRRRNEPRDEEGRGARDRSRSTSIS